MYRECIPIYVTFLIKNCCVGNVWSHSLSNIESVEKCRATQFGLYLVNQTLTCNLTTIGWFKFMANNAILINL